MTNLVSELLGSRVRGSNVTPRLSLLQAQKLTFLYVACVLNSVPFLTILKMQCFL